MANNFEDYIKDQFKNFSKVVNGYITPQMFGAKGDGITNDTEAVRRALAKGGAIDFGDKTYLCDFGLSVGLSNGVTIVGDGATIKLRVLNETNKKEAISIHGDTVNRVIDVDISGVNFELSVADDVVNPRVSNDLQLLNFRRKFGIINVHDCTFKSGTSSLKPYLECIRVEGGADNITISNNKFECIASGQKGGAIWVNPSYQYDYNGETVIETYDIWAINIDHNFIKHTYRDEAIGLWSRSLDTHGGFHTINIDSNTIIESNWNGECFGANQLVTVFSEVDTMRDWDVNISNNILECSKATQSIIKGAYVGNMNVRNNHIKIAGIDETVSNKDFYPVRNLYGNAVIEGNAIVFDSGATGIRCMLSSGRGNVQYIGNYIESDVNVEIYDHDDNVTLVGGKLLTSLYQNNNIVLTGAANNNTLTIRSFGLDDTVNRVTRLYENSIDGNLYIAGGSAPMELRDNTFNFLKTTPLAFSIKIDGQAKIVWLDNENITLTFDNTELTSKIGDFVYRGIEAGLSFVNTSPATCFDNSEITYLDTTTLDYPAYAKAEKESVLTQLKALYSIDNPIVIGFSTDQHLNVASPAIEQDVIPNLRTLRDLTKEFPFNLCVLGGDASSSSTSVADVNADVLKVTNALDGAECPIFHIIGNHDGSGNGTGITASAVFGTHRTMPIKNHAAVVNDESTNCYYDDESCKVRFIFIVSQTLNGYNSAVLSKAFLSNALSTLPNGYEAIIFSHHPLGNLTDNTSTRVDDWNEPLGWGDVVNPYANKIIACISGHVHADKHEMVDGILYMSTTCAGRYELNDGSTRPYGAADSTAYDVFVVDRTNYTIHAIRYGNGNNRDIVYHVISYTNQIPLSQDENGDPYNNGTGYKTGYRLNTSGQEVAQNGSGVTGFIPVNKGDTIRIKGLDMVCATGSSDRIALYDANHSLMQNQYAYLYPTDDSNYDLEIVTDENNIIESFQICPHDTTHNISYLRISANGLNENSVITVNEELD